MRGDRLVIESHHRRAAEGLAELLLPRAAAADRRFVVSIGGESGSGKSELARALADAFDRRSLRSVILQQDDYFVHPPKTNALKRREEIGWIGPGEVRLDRLDEDLHALRSGTDSICKPLVFYDEDRIGQETLSAKGVRVAIVEGTYVTLLANVDVRVFIERTFRETRDARILRAREAQDEFLERVLRIEHEIIALHRTLADVAIGADFSVKELVRES